MKKVATSVCHLSTCTISSRDKQTILFEEVLCEYLPFNHTKYLNIKKSQRLKFTKINIANYCFHIPKWNWLFIFKHWKYGMKNVKIWCPCLHLC